MDIISGILLIIAFFISLKVCNDLNKGEGINAIVIISFLVGLILFGISNIIDLI